jgi:hypothetical protein
VNSYDFVLMLQWLYGHMNRDQNPDCQLENGLGLYGSDEELGTQIPTQVQTITDGSGAVRVSEYKPSPDVDYLQVSQHSTAKYFYTYKFQFSDIACHVTPKLIFVIYCFIVKFKSFKLSNTHNS